MNPETEKLQEAIEQSFLSKEEKTDLTDLLKQEGATDAFHEKMNVIFISAIQKKGSISDELLTDFKETFQQLHSDYDMARHEFDTAFETALLEIKEGDVEATDRVTAQYEEDLKQIKRELETQTKELYGAIVAKLLASSK